MAERDILQPDFIRKGLNKSLFTTNIVFHETLNSTNLLAKELAGQGAPEGTLVLTEKQTAGRGRRSRQWFSQGYSNLLFSLLMRPDFQSDRIFILTMILALSTIDGIKEACGLELMIKWPNDLYLGRKKLAGILTEFSVRNMRTEYVVLGLGLNVNWSPEKKETLLYPATSLFTETGTSISRNELLISILKKFEDNYTQVLSGKIDEFYKRWNELSLIKGCNVTIKSDRKKLRGRAIRIENCGTLIIRDSKGFEQKIMVGDVSLDFES